MLTDIPSEQRGTVEACPISSQQPTHRRGREGDTKREGENILLSYAAFDFLFFLTLSLWKLSYAVPIELFFTLNYTVSHKQNYFCKGIESQIFVPVDIK